ncbi:MAG: VCBS repeat-containing protein [Planctomycetaceae bacterium]|nr:VCBS repeat-containing protein [Planctomycetaceae bacterium]
MLDGTLAAYNGTRVNAVSDAVANAPQIPLSVNGHEQMTGDQIVVSYWYHTNDYRDQFVLDSNGTFRIRHSDNDVAPADADSFGASFTLPPGLVINNGSGPEYFLGSRLTSLDLITTNSREVRIIANGNPLNAQCEILNGVDLEWTIIILRTTIADRLAATIETRMTVSETINLDPTAVANAEAFRVIMANSSNVPANRTSLGVPAHDSDQLVVAENSRILADVDLGTQTPNTPFFPGGLPASSFALNQRQAAPTNGDPPSFAIDLSVGAPSFRVQGYRTDGPDIDENSDNLSVWVSRDTAGGTVAAGSFLFWQHSVRAFDNPAYNATDEVGAWNPQLNSFSFRDGTAFTQNRVILPASTDWTFLQGDFDNDHFDEIAAFNGETGRWFLISDESTGPDSHPTLTVLDKWASNAAAGWSNFQVADFNGDGRDDILAQTSGGQLWGALSTGDRFVNHYFGRWTTAGWVTLQAGDFNGDGLADLAGLRESGQWVIGLSNGDRLNDFHYGRWNGAAGWHHFRLADFDKDGDVDILAQTDSGFWWVASLDEALVLRSHFAMKLPTNAEDDNALLGDFNGDGWMDLAGRNAIGEWNISLNDGIGQLLTPTVWWTSSTEFTWGFAAGDLDGNGMTDIAAYRDLDGQWFRITSTGSEFSNAIPWRKWDTFTRTEFLFGGDFRESTLL